MLQDFRFALRLMRKSPAFTAVAVLTLALGIGATTAIFSIVNAALLRPLPYRDPARLIMVTDRNVREGGAAVFFPHYKDFEEYARHQRTFDSIAAATWATSGTVLMGRGPALGVLSIPSSVSFFEMLGVKPALGRTFLPDDENRGCSVVLSDRFWRGKLAADRSIVGQSLALNRTACTVVGVMPPKFSFYPPEADLWRLDRAAMPPLAGIFGRLKPGVTQAQAQADLEAIFHGVHTTDEFRDFAPTVKDLQAQFTFLAGRNLRTTLLILLGAVVLVLLIACVNVANLLLGRGLVRGREFAIRAALGGGRGRLFRQLIVEGIVLGLFGGILGVAVAAGGLEYFQSADPVQLPVGSDLSLNLPILGFALLVSLATAVLFGMAPAWRGSAAALGARGVVGSRQRLVKLLVAAEMALSVVLLAGAGLLMESVMRMASAPLGFDPDRLYSTGIPVHKDAQFYETLESRIAAIPGVQSVALALGLPPYAPGNETFEILGTTPRNLHNVAQNAVTPSYFQTLGVALRAGRAFDAHDRTGSEPVAIVNDTLVREYFPNQNPIGQQVRTGSEGPFATIVGVVASEKQTVVTQEMQWVDRAILFRPLAQAPAARVSIAIRASSDAVPIGAAIRREVAMLEPDVAMRDLESMHKQLARFMAYPRFRAALLTAFAAFALLLAAIGLHGVLGQLVAQRTQEIGVRMALGARPADVARLIAGQGGLPVVAGLAAGLAMAMTAARYLGSLLYEVKPRDPLTLIGASLVLLAVAAAAIAMPARRAARTDPIEALREE